MKYYIQYITIYRGKIENPKVEDLSKILDGLKGILLSDLEAVFSLYDALDGIIGDLNVKHPSQKKWMLQRVGVCHFTIRPVDAKGLTEHVAHIDLGLITVEYDSAEIERYVNRLFLHQLEGGAE